MIAKKLILICGCTPYTPIKRIWSPDTDVAILYISHSLHFGNKLVFATGTLNRRRCINATAGVSHKL
jgi:hypothetical protein